MAGYRAGGQLHVESSAPIEPGRIVPGRDQTGTWRLRTVHDLGAGRLEAVANVGA